MFTSPSLIWQSFREPSSLRRLFAVAGITLHQMLLAANIVSAQSRAINTGIDSAISASELPRTGTFMAIIGQLVAVALQVMGIVFLVLTIYAGMRYMLARGEQGEVKKSIDTIQMAVIGLAIVMAAYAFTTFIFERLVGAVQ